MMADEERMPDLLLEQYALGELYGSEKSRVEARLAADPGLRRRLDDLGRSDADILAALPPAEIAASIRRRMLSMAPAAVTAAGTAAVTAAGTAKARGTGRARFLSGRALAFPAAAAVLLVAGVVAVRGLFPGAGGDIVLAKGGAPGLLVYKKASSGPALLSDGAQAAAGDVLQIKYAAGSARYGAIASLDGRGRVTWHLPAGAATGRAARIEAAGAALGSAYELDDAPGFERFFILSSSADFELSVVAKALDDLARSHAPDAARPTLPAGIEWKSLLLRKAGPPAGGSGGSR